VYLQTLLIAFLTVVSACATVSPEQEAARRIDAIKCEHEGVKAYRNSNWYYYEYVPRREQERLERLKLACVSAGGSVCY